MIGAGRPVVRKNLADTIPPPFKTPIFNLFSLFPLAVTASEKGSINTNTKVHYMRFPSVRRYPVRKYNSSRDSVCLKLNFAQHSPCEWALLERFLRSEVKSQGHCVGLQ